MVHIYALQSTNFGNIVCYIVGALRLDTNSLSLTDAAGWLTTNQAFRLIAKPIQSKKRV